MTVFPTPKTFLKKYNTNTDIYIYTNSTQHFIDAINQKLGYTYL
jgi:hypothetical protein